jgi:hypothetical protein
MSARMGLAAWAALASLAACNSHPLQSQTPHITTTDPPPENTLITPDGGASDVRRWPDAGDGRSVVENLADDRHSIELVSWVQSAGGTPIRVLKDGPYVFLGDWSNTAHIGLGSTDDGSIQTYHVAAPLLPVLKSTLFTAGQEMQDLAMTGRWLYAANDLLGLRLVDVSRPDSLLSVSNWVRPPSGYHALFATSVAVTSRGMGEIREDYALVGYLYGGGMDIHLVPDGGPIQEPIHYSSTALPSRCDVHQIHIQGDKAYLLASNGENQMYLEILDLSPLPALPTVLGRLALPMASQGGIGDIRVSGDMLYFSASQYAGASPHAGGLRIINVGDPRKPTLVGSLDLAAAGSIPWRGTGLALTGNQVFYLTSEGVQIIDVSKPSSPSARAITPYPSIFGTCQGGTAVIDGDLLYVGAYCIPPSGRGGLAIYRHH